MTSNTQIAVYEQIRKDITVKDGSEYKVPMSMVFGHGTMAKTESFGSRTLVENAIKVDEVLYETQELENIWNHSHSQWDWKHINLSYHSPEKNMRQIAAEISNKKRALNDAKWRNVKNEVRIRKLEEQLASGNLDYWKEVDIKIKLAEHREGVADGILYIEGAMKDVLALGELYDQLKNKISNFNEEDFEVQESKSHLKRSLVQCIRDVRQSGSITKGEQEYMEQIGVNPSKIQALIRKYVQEETQSEEWSTKGLHEFVEQVVNELIDVHKVDVKRMELMGFDPNPKLGISYDKPVAVKLEHKPEEE